MADVAQTLKLGVRQVEALENGDWGGLPGATFIRGFVRNYARLVQVDAAPDGTTRRRAGTAQAPPRPAGNRKPADAYRAPARAVITPWRCSGWCWWSWPWPSISLMPADLTELRRLVLVASDAKKEAAAVQPAVPEPVLPPGRRRSRCSIPRPWPGRSSPPAWRLALLRDAAVRRLPSSGSLPGSSAAAAERERRRCGSSSKESWIEVKGGDGNAFLPKVPPAAVPPAVVTRASALVVGNAPGCGSSCAASGGPRSPRRGDVARLVLD